MSGLIGADGSATPPAADLIKDATIETFQQDVLVESQNVPVIVDFWASWCGPCRTLGPMLESAVKARGGKVKMVKVDTDANQMLAQQLRIQSLPTVMAFIGGQPVDGFQGAIPESEVKKFLDRVENAASQMGLGGGQNADPKELIEKGHQALGAGDIEGATQHYQMAARQAEPGSDPYLEALAGIAETAIAADQPDQAQEVLDMVPEQLADHPALAKVKSKLKLLNQSVDPTAYAAELAAVDQNPSDPGAHLALGVAQIDAGELEGAVSALLKSIELDKEWQDGAAKTKLLELFDTLGPTNDLVKTGRRRLSSILFA